MSDETSVDVAALRAEHDKLPGGAWDAGLWGCGFIVAHVPNGDYGRIAIRTDGKVGRGYWTPKPQDIADGIAAVVNAFPGVLDEVEALRARVAALEAAVVDADGFCRICQMGVRHGAKHTQPCALSGDTSALEAHDAALLSRVRARVEALERYEGKWLDAVPMTRSSDGRWISRADVLAALDALDAKGGA